MRSKQLKKYVLRTTSEKITKSDIYMYNRGLIKWDEIDPCSSLEDEGNDSASDAETIIETGTKPTYYMRERKHSVEHHSTKPL